MRGAVSGRIVPWLAVLAALVGGHAWGASPWLPGPGKAVITTSWVYESFQEPYIGPNHFRLPGSVDQGTFYGLLEYGLAPTVALDVVSGYSKTTFLTTENSGSADTTIGLRWQVVRGERFVVTLRGAGIIAGSYPRPFAIGPIASGDKASGTQGSVLFGGALARQLFVYGEAGGRHRAGRVPNTFFGNVGLVRTSGGFTYGTSYQQNRAFSGLDIFGPGFDATLLRETKQIQGVIDFNVGYTTRNGLYFGFDYGRVIHGRNTGDKNIYAVSFGFTIPGHGPHWGAKASPDQQSRTPRGGPMRSADNRTTPRGSVR